MTDTLRIALAQLNPAVGDVDGNVAKLLAARGEAAEAGADLMVASELVIDGYPPEDLVLRPAFQDDVARGVAAVARETADGGPAVVLGASHVEDGRLFNAAHLIDRGTVRHTRLKHDLPNYGVFDEKRVFCPGPLPGPVPFRDTLLGIMICEDMWSGEVTECLEENGAEIMVVLNGSPFDVENVARRMNQAVARVTECRLPLIYVNQVGGQDELVFDGASFVLDASWALRSQLPSWSSSVVTTTWHRLETGWSCEAGLIAAEPDRLESMYRALVTGLADYVAKNGFAGVLIGLSGGIDSALSAAIATDALGSDRVWCVMMPSRYTSQESLDDATACAGLLGTRLDSVPIHGAVDALDGMLASHFAGRDPNEAEENIQARSRGMVLMALSNKFGHMVLSTGNKSEMSVGYATLYGDMCGGFSVLKDVYKTDVYRLAHWRSSHSGDGFLGPAGPVIPASIITKAPTAELRANQKDQDSLPAYEDLDDILGRLVEQEMTFDEIAAGGHDRALVEEVWTMLMRAEYKRRQAPPGVRITPRAFGRDRRYPVTNRFRR